MLPAVVVKVISRSLMRKITSLSIARAPLHILQLGRQRFAQPVADEVEAEHQKRQHQNGRQDLIGQSGDVIEPVLNQRTDRAFGQHDTDADEAQEGFGEDRRRDRENVHRQV